MKFKIKKGLFAIAIISILFTSCASSTIIDSIPSKANLYVNGQFVGKTPYKYKDTKIVGSSNSVRLEKEGFKVYNSSFSKDEKIAVGPLIGGLFFLFPYLWVMKYEKAHLYELIPLKNQGL